MTSFQNQVEAIPSVEARVVKVSYFPEIGSTNQEAIATGKAGSPGGTLVIADAQSAGHGRLGRPWESPAGKGLYFTLLLRPKFPPAHAPYLTLATGLALGRVLRTYGLPPLMIKWPNDIWIEGKKVAGILSEMNTQGADLDFVALGVGLNVSQSPEDFSADLREIAASLKQFSDIPWDRSELLRKILTEIFQEVESLEQEGPAQLIGRWEKESGMLGAKIQAQIASGTVQGEVLGLNELGHLKLRQDTGEILTLLAEDTTLL